SDGVPTHDATDEIRQRFEQYRCAAVRPIDFQVFEGWLGQVKPSSEVSHHVGLGVIEDVQRELGPWRQPARDRTVLADDTTDEWRVKRALLDPARQHAALFVAPSHRKDE